MATRRPTSLSLGESRIENKTDHRHTSDVIIMINNNSYNKTLIIKLTQLRTEDTTPVTKTTSIYISTTETEP